MIAASRDGRLAQDRAGRQGADRLSTNWLCWVSPRWAACCTKVLRSPPHEVDRITSGRMADRREISVEKSGAPKAGKNSPTTFTPGFIASSAVRKM